MSGRRDESLLLDDLVDAAERLLGLGSDVPPGYLGLERDLNEQILWNLVVLGEATKRLSAGVRTRFDDVLWAKMAQTRDRVTHHYEEIDWPLVADIINLDLPPLLPRLIAIRDTLRAEFDSAEESRRG